MVMELKSQTSNIYGTSETTATENVPNSITIQDVAKYIFEYLERPYISHTSLYKLLWFCQGWHYNTTGKPLFEETFEAWENGPVPKVLWNKFREKTELVEKEFKDLGDSKKITGLSQYIVDTVLERYGNFTPSALRDLSHKCTPWIKYFQKDDQTIPNDEIQEYFCEKI